MKKLSVHLSLLCLLVFLLIPFAGCKKEEPVEDTTTTDTTLETSTTEPAMTDIGTTDTGSTGTDLTTSEPLSSGQ